MSNLIPFPNSNPNAAPKLPSSLTGGMSRAFAGVRGALRRKDNTELKCKQVWLERCIRELPASDIAEYAGHYLQKVNQALGVS